MKILLVDDHVLVRNGIKALLEGEQDISVIGEASDGVEALDFLKLQQPDVLLIDIRMPRLNGIKVVREVSKLYDSVKTMVLSMHDSKEYVLEAIDAGADGYLLKGSTKQEFIKALRSVADGGKYFSGDISEILVNRMTNKAPSNTKNDIEHHNELSNLTDREKQILDLILKGNTNKEVASLLGVSVRTTEVHRFNLMKKMKVKNLMELANKVAELNK